LWLHSLKVAQLLRSAACLHTNQSRSYLNHLVLNTVRRVRSGRLEPAVYVYLTHFMCSLLMSLLVCHLVDWLFDIIFRHFTKFFYV